VACGKGGDDTRIEPSGEERTEGHVAHQAFEDGIFQSSAQLSTPLLGGRFISGLLFAPGWREAVEGTGGSTVAEVPWWDGGDGVPSPLCQCLQLGRVGEIVAVLGPIKRFDPDRVTGGHGLALFVDDDQGEYSIEEIDEIVAVLAEQGQEDGGGASAVQFLAV